MKYYIASDSDRWLRDGDQSAGLGYLSGSRRWPDGQCHAVPVGISTTRCGSPVQRLVMFPDLDFQRTYTGAACIRCSTNT